VGTPRIAGISHREKTLSSLCSGSGTKKKCRHRTTRRNGMTTCWSRMQGRNWRISLHRQGPRGLQVRENLRNQYHLPRRNQQPEQLLPRNKMMKTKRLAPLPLLPSTPAPASKHLQCPRKRPLAPAPPSKCLQHPSLKPPFKKHKEPSSTHSKPPSKPPSI